MPLLLLASAAFFMLHFTSETFIAPRRMASAPITAVRPGVQDVAEDSQGMPDIKARGGADEQVVENPGTYIVGMSLFMIVSVAANANGFFGPWKGGDGKVVENPGTYIIGMSLFMIVSVAANANGFFGTW